MAFSIFFSGASINGADNGDNTRDSMQVATNDENSLTKKQKEQINNEDAEMLEHIKKVKKSKKNSEKRTVVKELKKLRTENSNTYLLSDGSKKIEIFGEDNFVILTKNKYSIAFAPANLEKIQGIKDEIDKEEVSIQENSADEIGEKNTENNNQLTKVTSRTGGTSGPIQYTQENTYNYDGKRISRTENGQTTFFYYQKGILLYTTDDNGNKKCQNIIEPKDNIIAKIHYDNGQHAFFYNKDIETSVTNIVNESGNGVVSYQYDDYGTTTKYGNTDFYNEICYTSGVYDELTGLYYLNARYYSPEEQRFMSQDSYRGDQADYTTWNLYAYCGENPIKYTDPSGHKSKSVTIPKGKGTVISYMGYHLITSPSSEQYKLKNKAIKNKDYTKKKPEYYSMIKGRIVIATTPNIGGKLKVYIGDYLIVYFKRSNHKTKKYKCIIGDFKGADAGNSWGHYNGQGVVEVIYHNYNPPKGYRKNENNPWGKGRVIKIKRTGKKYK